MLRPNWPWLNCNRIGLAWVHSTWYWHLFKEFNHIVLWQHICSSHHSQLRVPWSYKLHIDWLPFCSMKNELCISYSFHSIPGRYFHRNIATNSVSWSIDQTRLVQRPYSNLRNNRDPSSSTTIEEKSVAWLMLFNCGMTYALWFLLNCCEWTSLCQKHPFFLGW